MELMVRGLVGWRIFTGSQSFLIAGYRTYVCAKNPKGERKNPMFLMDRGGHLGLGAFKLRCWRRLLRVLWTARRSNQSILKEISPEYSLEGLMLKPKLQYFSHLMAKNWLTGKDPDAGKDWRQEEKATTEDEIFGWHHWLDGRESEWTPGVGDVQGGLACCDSWSRKESDTTEQLNWTELIDI